MGIRIPDTLLVFIAEESERIHHGTIRIEINSDRPGRFDVVTERRERFSGAAGTVAGAVEGAARRTGAFTGLPG